MYCQHRDGKVRYFESYIDPTTGKRKRTSVTMDRDTTHTRKEAAEKLRKKIKALQDFNDVESISLAELISAHLRASETRSRPSTYRTKASRLKVLAELLGASTDVNKITPAKIDEALSQYNGKDVKSLVQHLKTLIHFGARYGYVSDTKWIDSWTPWAPAKEEKSAADLYLTDEEVSGLIDAIEEDFKGLTRVLILTGMRIGEALALTTSDVTGPDPTLHISKTWDHARNQPGPPKTKQSDRWIYIQPELRSVIDGILDTNEKTRSEIHDQGDRLFIHSITAKPITYDDYRYALKKAAKAAGIVKNVTPHMLRHTHASILYANMIDKDTISRRLGHSHDDDTTMRIYVHITAQREAAEREQMDRISILKATKSATTKNKESR